MPRIIMKFDDVNHVNSVDVDDAIDVWLRQRDSFKSLKMLFEEQGRAIVMYEKGISDALRFTGRRD